jgi:hypothetical protein
MAHLDFDNGGRDLDSVRRMVRRSAHAQRAQAMLMAAGLAALGVVAVAGAMLSNLV